MTHGSTEQLARKPMINVPNKVNSPQLDKLMLRIALASCIAVFVCASLVLTGWISQNELLQSLLPEQQVTQASTAIAFLLAAGGQVLWISSNRFPRLRRFSRILAILVVLAGA